MFALVRNKHPNLEYLGRAGTRTVPRTGEGRESDTDLGQPLSERTVSAQEFDLASYLARSSNTAFSQKEALIEVYRRFGGGEDGGRGLT